MSDMDDTSRDEGELKEMRGRGMNTLNEDYLLPADRTEMERLSVQHRMWCMLAGGIYPPTLKSTLEEALEGPNAMILDAGCGSAIWAAHVVGVDLARNFQQDPPVNYEFIQMDMSNGLPLGGYDLIHARLLLHQIKDPRAFLRHAHAALKPGGIFLVADSAGLPCSRDKKELAPRYPTSEAAEDSSWSAGMVQVWFELTSRKPIERIFEDSPFSVTHLFNYFCPIGREGDAGDVGAELGSIGLKNIQWAHAASPAVLASGKYDRETIDLWLGAIEEECKSKKMYIPWIYVVARREK
ncbi:S-adenosyl-L-methionine-dependent methyltransferase [Roridomyces roridus]|uniref:S-adenosyl-L-methionine-dependent methyltransferase n=1 Tax=Roridomyces roridus TaxID=1738132 RepID=A0AAD7BXQ0_9AGAR|nr:S-adenosyl-L-methionine-dependent methyltransferase [Roridomyces roridus]